MRLRIGLGVFAWLIVRSLSTDCSAQVQLEVEKALLNRADEYAFDLAQRRAKLPEKWAARQECTKNDLTGIDAIKVGVTEIIEFTAHHRSKNITYQRYREDSHVDNPLDLRPAVDRQSDPFSNVDIRAHISPGYTLYKNPRYSRNLRYKSYKNSADRRGEIPEDREWKIVPVLPKTEYKFSDPYNALLGVSLDEKGLDFFFAESRVCVSARETPKGLLSWWGFPELRKNGVLTSVLFDKSSKLPIEVEWDFYPKTWDPKAFTTLEHETMKKVKVTWQEFKDRGSKIHLPVRVEQVATSDGIRPIHVETVNRIRWLLNDEVPDSLFEDPKKKNEIVEPKFPDYPEDRIRTP